MLTRRIDVSGVSVIGLGKLGACTAASIAHKGIPVIGVDASAERVHALNSGRSPLDEPGLAEMIKANRTRLRATQDYQEAILASDMTFIVVPTPSRPDGGFSLQYVQEVGLSLGKALRQKDEYHLVVLTSTVLPGSTEYGLKPVLERASGKVCGEGFGLCYGPEFIALGTVIRDFLNPDFILIGESDPRAGDVLSAFYKQILDKPAPIARMNFVNAELTKMAVNTFVTTKITFANMLADLCEQLPGGDVDVVTSALGLDSRIGDQYLKGGLGYGGPCFPRDNQALSHAARQLGRTAPLAETTDTLNRELGERFVQQVVDRVLPGSTVAVLGLSYKPLSSVVEESWGLYLAARLADAGISVVVHDPTALDTTRRVLGDRVRYASALQEALSQADVAVVVNPDPTFQGIRPEDFGERPVVVFDCWRLLREALEDAPGLDYVPLGVGQNKTELAERLRGIPWGRERA